MATVLLRCVLEAMLEAMFVERTSGYMGYS